MSCQHCKEIQEERSAIHQFDGDATRAQADELASKERCQRHRLKIPVDGFKVFDSL